MKKIVPIVFIAFISMVILISWNITEAPASPQEEELDLGFPEEVMTILETSCFDCHTAGSKNDKAKTKLNYSKWSELKASKKIGKLDATCEEVQEGNRPPEKGIN
jgi:hypothetical protein